MNCSIVIVVVDALYIREDKIGISQSQIRYLLQGVKTRFRNGICSGQLVWIIFTSDFPKYLAD